MKILVLNSGSSSCKMALYEFQNGILDDPQSAVWSGVYEWNSSQSLIARKEAMQAYLNEMPISLKNIDVIGHRIVHGGDDFHNPVVVTDEVKAAIRRLFPLAPLHNAQSLEGIEVIESMFPQVMQVAVFDTAFHATLSPAASTYAGPYVWKEMGIKRYGFHGISYEYCAARCSKLLGAKHLKFVCCHLGNGASLAAIDGKSSVDTTMGFTPIEGVMMGSRSGSVDPGILLFLQQYHGETAESLLHMLNHSSGLLGISGASGDMRDILRLCSEGDVKAKLSLDMYVHSLKRNIGAMVGVLKGFDALVFTGGVGENASLVREMVCEGLQHLGVVLDSSRNNQCKADTLICSADSKVRVAVIKAQEDWCIACKIEKMRSHGTI